MGTPVAFFFLFMEHILSTAGLQRETNLPSAGRKKKKGKQQKHKGRTKKDQDPLGRAKQGTVTWKWQQNHQIIDSIPPGNLKGSAMPLGRRRWTSGCKSVSEIVTAAALGHFSWKKQTRTEAPFIKGQVTPPNYLPHLLRINKTKDARNWVF